MRPRVRNHRGSVRTDFGARWLAGRVYWDAEKQLVMYEPPPCVLLPYFEVPDGFYGLGIADMLSKP